MVRIRFFAMLKRLAGTDSMDYDIKAPVTVGGLKERLGAEKPGLSEILATRSLLVSVNQEFATDDTVVKDGDEVAFLPPFSGG